MAAEIAHQIGHQDGWRGKFWAILSWARGGAGPGWLAALAAGSFARDCYKYVLN